MDIQQFDFCLDQCGGIFVLTAQTENACLWTLDHLPEDATGSVFIEHRYIDDIVRGIFDAGMRIESAGLPLKFDDNGILIFDIAPSADSLASSSS
jgi:hypothetical protein